MTHQALARKWRPKTFAEMVGQHHVLTALANSLDQQRLHHAYLFTGTRGVGKTTIGRVLAKCLECERGISSKPCGVCNTCLAFDKGYFPDLIEIDGASKTKVEDTREVLDNVQYAPTMGRYKIYLIDEVHMLSGHSFNALLKTLEEPPEHVKFLLATTDPQKLPVTVLSRCLQFSLKNMLPEQIVQHLEFILKEEQLNFEPGALREIAFAANGSMRDALSLLDQSIAFCNGAVTEHAVQDMLGSVHPDHILALLEALSTRDANKLLAVSDAMMALGSDFDNALQTLITLLQNIALLQTLPDAAIDHPELRERLSPLATLISAEDIQLFYQIALLSRKDLPLVPNPKRGFDMMLLRMLTFQPEKKSLE